MCHPYCRYIQCNNSHACQEILSPSIGPIIRLFPTRYKLNPALSSCICKIKTYNLMKQATSKISFFKHGLWGPLILPFCLSPVAFFDYKGQLCNLRGGSKTERKKEIRKERKSRLLMQLMNILSLLISIEMIKARRKRIRYISFPRSYSNF